MMSPRSTPAIAAGLPGSTSVDEHAAILCQPVKAHHARMQRHVLARHADRAAPDAAFLDQPRGDELRGVARDGEADALRRQNDRGVHADDFARADSPAGRRSCRDSAPRRSG